MTSGHDCAILLLFSLQHDTCPWHSPKALSPVLWIPGLSQPWLLSLWPLLVPGGFYSWRHVSSYGQSRARMIDL